MAAMRALHAGTITMSQAWEYDEKAATPEGRMERHTAAEWLQAHPVMLASGDDIIVALVNQHDRLIESRSDWTECQKNARRRVLLDQWRQSLNIEYVWSLEAACASTCAVAVITDDVGQVKAGSVEDWAYVAALNGTVLRSGSWYCATTATWRRMVESNGLDLTAIPTVQTTWFRVEPGE